MDPITLTFTMLPISTNCLFRSYRGRVCKSKKYREWQVEITKQLNNQYHGEVLECPLEMEVVFTKSSKRKYDVDNCFKSLLDTLEGVCYKNDSQIIVLKGSKVQGLENRIDVILKSHLS